MQISKDKKLSSNLSDINIIPLVDIMLVLLIIFMVTTPMMQSGIHVNLPSAETRANPSPDGLVITITKGKYIYIDDKIINKFLLESRLKNHFFNTEKKIVFLKADKDISYGFIIEVMDIIKKAGIETVGMIVEQKEKK